MDFKSKFSKDGFKAGLSAFRAALEQFGRAILVPVTVIPLLALIAAIGYTGQAIIAQVFPKGGPKVAPKELVLAIDAIKDLGLIAIANIDFLVAVGLAAGLAKSEKFQLHCQD